MGEKEKPTTNLEKSSLSCIVFRRFKFKNFASKCKLVHLGITKEGSCSSFCVEFVNWALWNDKLLKYVYNLKTFHFHILLPSSCQYITVLTYEMWGLHLSFHHWPELHEFFPLSALICFFPWSEILLKIIIKPVCAY